MRPSKFGWMEVAAIGAVVGAVALVVFFSGGSGGERHEPPAAPAAAPRASQEEAPAYPPPAAPAPTTLRPQPIPAAPPATAAPPPLAPSADALRKAAERARTASEKAIENRNYRLIIGRQIWVKHNKKGEERAQPVIARLKELGANVLVDFDEEYPSWDGDLDYQPKDEAFVEQVLAAVAGLYKFTLKPDDGRISPPSLWIKPQE